MEYRAVQQSVSGNPKYGMQIEKKVILSSEKFY